MHENGNVLLVSVKIASPAGDGGRRQDYRKENARVLGELGFALQEGGAETMHVSKAEEKE